MILHLLVSQICNTSLAFHFISHKFSYKDREIIFWLAKSKEKIKQQTKKATKPHPTTKDFGERERLAIFNEDIYMYLIMCLYVCIWMHPTCVSKCLTARVLRLFLPGPEDLCHFFVCPQPSFLPYSFAQYPTELLFLTVGKSYHVTISLQIFHHFNL